MDSGQIRWETKRVVEFINEIESSLDIGDLFVDGFHVWPLLRIQLAFQLDSLIHKPHSSRSSQQIKTAFDKIIRIPKEVCTYYFSKFADHNHNSSLHQKADCFFYTYSSARRFQVNGGWYDVFCDPIVTELQQKNISSISLEYTDSSGYRIPRYSSSVFEHPLQVYGKQFQAFRNRNTAHSEKSLTGLKQYYEILKKNKLERCIPDEASLSFRVAMVRGYAEIFKNIFKYIKPKIALGSNYYGFREMGMNLACREQGICSVDIQHGVQGMIHIAYGRWLNIPPSGYEVLPKIFWNWSKEEKSVIDQWAHATNGFHRSIVGGNPLLEQFSDENNILPTLFKKKINDIFSTIPPDVSKHVLVTLQPEVGILNTLFEVLKSSHGDTYWWIRLHPNMSSNVEIIEHQLSCINTLQYNLKAATSLPLHLLLKRMDLHITVSSSVVIEAEYFGIPSIIIHESGKEMYPKQIASGIAVFAQSSESITYMLSNLHKQSPKQSTDNNSMVKNGLDELLRLSQ